jgi:hypothetical protein
MENLINIPNERRADEVRLISLRVAAYHLLIAEGDSGQRVIRAVALYLFAYAVGKCLIV